MVSLRQVRVIPGRQSGIMLTAGLLSGYWRTQGSIPKLPSSTGPTCRNRRARIRNRPSNIYLSNSFEVRFTTRSSSGCSVYWASSSDGDGTRRPRSKRSKRRPTTMIPAYEPLFNDDSRLSHAPSSTMISACTLLLRVVSNPCNICNFCP